VAWPALKPVFRGIVADHNAKDNGTAVSDDPVTFQCSVDVNGFHNILSIIFSRGRIESRVFSGGSTDQGNSGLDYA